MKKKKKLPKSIKKFIRSEKAKIRKENFEILKQRELIKSLYEKFRLANVN